MTIRELVMIPLVTAITSVLAYVAIPLPFSPVPITGQTLGVMLAGGVLGKKGGALSMVLLLLLGFAGVPVFAGGLTGPAKLFGPTGGYIFAWPVAAFCIGWLLELWSKTVKRPRFAVFFVVNILFGVLFVALSGVSWLAWQQQLSWTAAVTSGFLPYLPGDLLKAAVAAVVSVRLHRLGLSSLPVTRRNSTESRHPSA